MTPHRRLAVIAALVVLLGVSGGANVWLAQYSLASARRLHRTRLDPFGLKHYPLTAQRPPPPATAEQQTLAVIGDSRAAAWPAPRAVPQIQFINRGIGGQTSAQVAGRFAAHVTPLQPDIVLLQVGINDLRTIPFFPDQHAAIIADCKRYIDQLVGDAQQLEARVVVTTIVPFGRLPVAQRLWWSDDVEATIHAAIRDVNHHIRSLANEQVIVLDTAKVLADDHGQTRTEYSRDFLHLNAAGYDALNQELTQILTQSTPYRGSD